MSKPGELRALVVDDERAAQALLKRALTQQGFACDTAGDGNEAEECMSRVQYDAVVTDIRMPNKHGHALAIHVLSLKRRPVVVIHTSVIEPKLAKDLLARGVDDIVFKPFDLTILATKVRVLVDRRESTPCQLSKSETPNSKTDEMQALLADVASLDEPVSIANIKGKLASLSRILPISKAAIDVYNMTSTNQWETEHIAAAILRDATLAAEVLRLANSSFYNPAGQHVVQLERAIVQIGQKRVGELSLATNALTALTSAVVPWMDIRLTWKQSMAAGLALERLIDCGTHQHIEEGLLLSAIMHPQGRVVMGTLYPRHYEALVRQCMSTGESLLEQERAIFPVSHAEVAADLLATWNIPPEVHSPLKHVLESYTTITKLPEPTRTKVELVKLAIFVGRAAIGSWEGLEFVELPPRAVIEKLKIGSLIEMIAQTRDDVEDLAKFRTDRPVAQRALVAPASSCEIGYCDLARDPYDVLGQLLSSMGIKLVKSPAVLNSTGDSLVVNCLGSPNLTLPTGAEGDGNSSRRLLIIADAEHAEAYRHHGRTIAFPISYSRLRAACWFSAKKPENSSQIVAEDPALV